MLKKYSIENFKAFSESQSFDMSDITLIYGQNSSGKSSIIQSLMLLKQTLIENIKPGGLVTDGAYISLGEHCTLINKHDENLNINLSFDFETNISIGEYQNIFMQDPPFGSSENSEKRSFSLSYSYNTLHGRNKSSLDKVSFKSVKKKVDKPSIEFSIVNNNSYASLSSPSHSFYFDEKGAESVYKFVKNRESKTRKLSNSDEGALYKACNSQFHFSDYISLPIRSSDRDWGEVVNVQMNRIFSEVRYEVSKIKYLGPLRSYPKRFYSSKDVVGNFGEGDFSNIFNSKDDELIERINYWFSKFEIPYLFSVENVGNEITGRIISIQLTDFRNNTTVTPVDVGFGIGQVLPIIIESVANRNSIICVEQPEIHLHPRLQAHLADLFIESVTKYKNQWVIETHSESLMLRLQRRIREKVLDSSKLNVVYVQAGEDGSSIQNLPLDEAGRFLVHWPEGFFEERMREQFGK